MVKTRRAGGIYYCCGSYKRYGPTVCSKHSVSHGVLEAILLKDLNQVISAVRDIKTLADEADAQMRRSFPGERGRLESGLERLYRLKKAAYEDYREGLIRREDFVRYQADYQRQERELSAQLEQMGGGDTLNSSRHPWVEGLLQHGKLTELDRVTVAEAVRQILIFADGRIDITYTFSASEPFDPVHAPE